MSLQPNFRRGAGKRAVASPRHEGFGRLLPLLVCRQTDRSAMDQGYPEPWLGSLRYGDCFGPEQGLYSAECGIPLRCLGSGAVELAWLGCAGVRGGRRGGLTYRYDGETLFGGFRDPEAGPQTIGQSAYSAYRAMLDAAIGAGYPYVYRIWNYLPEINREVDGLEVYKAFCIGRRKAFDRHPTAPDAVVPAACAIGTRVPGLHLSFLASKHPVQRLSNPRQMEAYHYPPQYGPKAPAFSRAVLVARGGSVAQLHISGTASIVGHATRHVGDIDAQVAETLINLAALLRRVGLGYGDLGRDAQFTIYLRRETDLQRVRNALSSVLAPEVALVFLQGDICRRSLLLEIEGIISLDAGIPPEGSIPGCN